MITLHKGQYLSDVMSEIPSNCILSKRIPGCGATTLELETQRNSIIVVPNVPVIKSKCGKYSNLLGVYEDVTTDKIRNYLTNNRLHKIMTTPESFGKVKNACSGIDIYNHFFLLMDECHQLIKDVDYRTDIVLPMNDFFRFKSKALVSATPIGFSDPRFKEFETVEVSADYDYRQEIAVTHTYNIYKAISEYLGNHTEETVCFFVNSVVMIYSIMKQFGILEDSTVYCAPKSRLKLKNEYSFDNAYNDWNADTMKKYNFFTGRFFTAFDLDLPYQPDLVMVTDPYNSEYTILDIDTDCIQICGRFRNGIKSATHIYRVNPEIITKDREQIEWEISEHENKNVFRYVEQLLKGHLCNNYNIGIFASKHNDIDPKLKDLKDIIIRYYPQKDNELLNSVLYDIINCEHDLYFHCLIEEHLFIPEVMDLEERLKKDSEIREIEIEDYEEKQEKLNKAALLSEREKGGVACIAQGMSNKEIAEQLCLSVNTVTTHRRNISMKLGIHSAASITIFAIVNKIVEIPGKS